MKYLRNVLSDLRPLGLVMALISTLVVLTAPTAEAQVQQLKLPFEAGGVQVVFDETYTGTTPHPTNGAIAFDLAQNPHDPRADVLAIGDGDVRWLCTHKSGSAILEFQADGYAGSFYFIHLEDSTLPTWLDDQWRPVVRGERIGSLYPNPIAGQNGDWCLQWSTGSHLHLDMPSLGIDLDGVTFTEEFPNDGELITSTNSQPGQPASALCGGFDATIIGTTGNDTLFGTEGPDVIAGLQGNDTIWGLGGDDVICGGIGDDVLYGDQGFDVIYGAQGNDRIFSTSGSAAGDRIDTKGGRFFGGKGNDIIHGSERWDRMQGGPGADSLWGYAGRDWMRGGSESDWVEGGRGIDDLHGGNGADRIIAGGGDTVRGGASLLDECNIAGGQPDVMISCEIVTS